MASSRAQEFRCRLIRWEEEYRSDPTMTEITPELIKQLKALIEVVGRIERDLGEAEDAVTKFLEK